MKLPDARELHNQYVAARPFAHMVFRHMFGQDTLRRVSYEVDCQLIEALDNDTIKGNWSTNDVENWGQFTTSFVDELRSRDFCKWLSRLTGTRNLFLDPSLYGCGLRAIGQGGKLKPIHTDKIWCKRLQARRKVCVLVFLNEDWNEDWGGHFNMWTQDLEHCVQHISPRISTTVILDVDSNNYHV